jgi:hypothetical protein
MNRDLVAPSCWMTGIHITEALHQSSSSALPSRL